MRVLIQRVTSAKVEWEGGAAGPIGKGLLCLVGFGEGDEETLIAPIVDKLVNLRIFEDEGRRMNRSLLDLKGDLMLVPQFTLYADCSKGRRPGFSAALAPERAKEFFTRFEESCGDFSSHFFSGRVFSGGFGASMQVHLVNDGPVTIMLDSEQLYPASTTRT
ncbi:MAG: D-aminoacyl-tRNA deacylase [bacterium]